MPHRGYCSAIAAVTDRVALAPRRAVPLSEAKVDWGEFVASRPGQFAAADVATPEGDAMTVVSLYGIWDKIPETGQLFADATLHRAISDLAVLSDQRGGNSKVLVAGDLNVWHSYGNSGECWAQRFHTVFDRLAAHGLHLLGPSGRTTVRHSRDAPVDRRLAGTSTRSGTSGTRRRPRTRTTSFSLRSSSRVCLRTTAASPARTTTSGPTATTAPWWPASK